jgi:two-component system cell cycle sensor histidine kinase/response regulator CckA
MYYSDAHPATAPAISDGAPSSHDGRQNPAYTDWQSTGVLHDFNNLLAIILSHAAIALTKLPTDHPAHNYIERVVRTTKRAADISSQLLVNLSRQWVEPMAVDLNRVVLDTIELLEPKLTPKAEIKLQLKTNVSPVLANITQMQQVVMNLLLNAAEAIEQAPGRITIATGDVMLTETRPQISLPRLPAGPYAYLQIIDTGSGMDQALINRIFEPHFTTKAIGTGIGLTATLAIIQMHQGAIRVFSTPGRGTTFQVFLPIISRDQDFMTE